MNNVNQIKPQFLLILYLQPKNIDTLCKAVVNTAEKYEPDLPTTQQHTLITAAQAISRKFTRTFTLFAGCHNTYNSSEPLHDEDVQTLGKYSGQN